MTKTAVFSKTKATVDIALDKTQWMTNLSVKGYKTLLEKEKMLFTSIHSLSHVFKRFSPGLL